MVTKVSEITTKDIADFIRLGEVSDADEKQLQTFLTIAKDYISNYTALEDLYEYRFLDPVSNFVNLNSKGKVQRLVF